MHRKRYGFKMILVILFALSTHSLWAENSSNGMVMGRSVCLRAGPSLQAGILMLLNEGFLVEVMEKKDSWFRITFGNGKGGWIYQDYITTETNAIQNRIELINQARKLAGFAKMYLGFPYAYGGKGPSGFDCSGYTMYIYEKFGYKLPHSASSQMNFGQEIRRSELALGDLIFFKTMRSASINHVGIYLGDGVFIHAASGSGRIKIDSVFSRYYNSRYWGARRIFVYKSLRNQNSK